MPDPKALLELADQFIESHTGSVLSQVQRLVLVEALTVRAKAKTYDQVATETGYSSGYIKAMAADLWKLLSKAIGKKVTKGNVQTILQQQRETSLSQSGELPVEQPQPIIPTGTGITAGPDTNLLEIAPKATEASKATEAKLIQGEAKTLALEGASAILVVDDQPHNVALLTDIMEQDEYEVWQATHGAEALDMATKVLPDLILLDVNMPDMDGYAVCQQLKADPRTTAIPIIFVSALDGSWDKVKAFSVGGSDYITKPFNTLEVMVRIENQLKIRRLQHQMLRAEQAADSSSPSQPSPKATILMVDDEPKNLALLTDVLEQEGYEIWQADSGSEALRVAGMVLPDLILLDINMPDMQGYDVCQQLKADGKTKLIPVIFISALDATWDKVKAFSVGGSDYINKPIQIVELMARVKHQLQIWRI